MAEGAEDAEQGLCEMIARPLAIDLFCGLGGWSEGLLAAGWNVVGFDIEQHVYGADRYPAQLVIQDVLTLHGRQFRDAELIVASPPCQAYSYMAMPWSRAKAKAAAIRADETGAALEDLNRLFNACFRIQQEACEAAGRYIPLVVENVRGAQPWVGRARWNFGSYYLFGDVPALMPPVLRRVSKTVGHTNIRDGHPHTKRLTNEAEFTKVPGFRFDGSGGSFQSAAVAEHRKAPAGTQWFNDGPRTKDSLASSGSKSPARKAASARIAKIPSSLSHWIARAWFPKPLNVNGMPESPTP